MTRERKPHPHWFFDDCWMAHVHPTTQWMLMGIGDGSAAAPGANFLVQESDGVSKFTLENGTGSILLEN